MGDFSWLGKLLMGMGFLFLIMGAFLLLFSKISGLERLPGDIYFSKGNFTFYFPIVTSIVLSILLSLILRLFRH